MFFTRKYLKEKLKDPLSDQDRTRPYVKKTLYGQRIKDAIVLRVGRAEVGRVSHMGFTEHRRRLLLLLRAGIGYPQSPIAN